jgi:hypothetical protein
LRSSGGGHSPRRAERAPPFGNNILNKRYSIIETPANRWSIADYYDPDPKAPDKTYSKIGGWVRAFSSTGSASHAAQSGRGHGRGQQWAVTIAAEALADYGYPNRPLDTERTGVILGTAMGGELHYITTTASSSPNTPTRCASRARIPGLPATRAEAMMDQWHAVMRSCRPSPKTPCPANCPTSSPGAWPTCSTCAARTSSPTPPAPPASPPSSGR